MYLLGLGALHTTTLILLHQVQTPYLQAAAILLAALASQKQEMGKSVPENVASPNADVTWISGEQGL